MMEEEKELEIIFENEFEPDKFEYDEYELEEKYLSTSDEGSAQYLKFKSKSITDSDISKKSSEDESTENKTILSSLSSESVSITSSKSTSEKSLTHPCLKQFSISDSQLKFLDLYNFYPIPKDPGLNKAFWILYPRPPIYNPDGIDKFFYIVKLLGLTPIECLKQQLKSNKVDLKYYGFDPEIVHALSEAMLFNTSVKSLDLQENQLTEDACYYLNRLLFRNTALSSVNLTACKIGKEGAMRLVEGISLSPALRELNLSRCDLGNEGFAYIANAVTANTLIRSLNISQNNLDEGSAIHLQKMLKSTESLERLNLSWNDFHTKEASEKLFGGLLQNITLKSIDLSWNVLGKHSVYSISHFIANSKKLERLDLTANRLTDSEVPYIARALLTNKSIHELYLNQNPIGSNGISNFIKILNSFEFFNSPLLLLDLESFWTTKDSMLALDQLKQMKPNLIMKLGGILENFKIIGPDLKELFFKTANYEAMNTKKKRDRKNFGHFVLSLNDSKINKERFKDLLSDAKIKISDNLAKEIINQFLVTKRSLDQAALKESYLSYFPDTKLPEPPKPKEVVTEKVDSKEKSAKDNLKQRRKEKIQGKKKKK